MNHHISRALLAAFALTTAAACTATETPDSPSTSSAVQEPLSLVVLGDSNAHESSCLGCAIFPDQVAQQMRDELGAGVEVENLAWVISAPKAAEVRDIREYVENVDFAREKLQAADAVVIFVSQNDLPYNRLDDPCDVAPNYPRIRWAGLTHECIDTSLAEYARDLDALLSEIEELRAGRATMLRVVTAINTTPGDLVDPTWNSPAAIEPSAYSVRQMADIQCSLARRHGGTCVDVLPAFNGPDERDSAQRFLNPKDATHLTQRGHDLVADTLVANGFDPLG